MCVRDCSSSLQERLIAPSALHILDLAAFCPTRCARRLPDLAAMPATLAANRPRERSARVRRKSITSVSGSSTREQRRSSYGCHGEGGRAGSLGGPEQI